MRNASLYQFGLVALVAGFIGCATSTTGGFDTTTEQLPAADAVVFVQGLTCPS